MGDALWALQGIILFAEHFFFKYCEGLNGESDVELDRLEALLDHEGVH